VTQSKLGTPLSRLLMMFDIVQNGQKMVWQQTPVSSVQEQMPSCQCGGPRVRAWTSDV